MLPAFDAEKHHIGLRGSAGGSPGSNAQEIGFLIAGAYSKAFKRQIIQDPVGVRYGTGASLVNNPNVSAWSQDDFSGGAFQRVWRDSKMFADGGNILPTSFDRTVRSVPPLALVDYLGPNLAFPQAMFSVGGKLICSFGLGWSRTDLQSGAFDVVLIPGRPFVAQSYDRRTRSLYASFGDGGPTDPVNTSGTIQRYNPLTGAFINGYTTPLAVPGPVTAINNDLDVLVLVANGRLVTLKIPDNEDSQPVDADYVEIGRLPGKWVGATALGGVLYILLADDDTRTQLVQFDGVSILPVTDFPYNFVGESICSYAGRIYVGGSGRDVNNANAYAELYEVTGASVRLVHTFASDAAAAGVYSPPRSIHSMAVHEGLLFFGDTSSGLIAYDVTTDALYPAQRFLAGYGSGGSGSGDREVRGLLSVRGDLWMFVRDTGNGNFNGIYRPYHSGEGLGLPFNGVVETSDFTADFDRLKQWKQLRVLTRFGPAAAEVSFDGGETFSSLTGSSEPTGRLTLTTFDLSALPTGRQARFRILLPRNVADGYTELLGYTVSYTYNNTEFLSHDGSEKLAWTFAVNGAETVELNDGEDLTQELASLRSQLWAWARAKDELTFRDTDGATYTVRVDSITENQPAVLPNVPFLDHATGASSEGREAFFNLTLVEV